MIQRVVVARFEMNCITRNLYSWPLIEHEVIKLITAETFWKKNEQKKSAGKIIMRLLVKPLNVFLSSPFSVYGK